MNPTDVIARPAEWARKKADSYRGASRRPLGGYLMILGVYGSVVSGLAGLARRTGKAPPERVTPWDVALFGIATHRVSRTLAKDPVTSPLRAPFTKYVGVQGPAELAEEVRSDSHLDHTLGELLSCPFCLSQWVATGFCAGWVFAPRVTKLVAATFATVATSDFLQYAYAAVEQRA